MTDDESEKPRRRARIYKSGDIREPVILRVRMRRGMLNQIKQIVAYDRELIHEAWNVSDACREILREWIERRFVEMRSAGVFTGKPPDKTSAGDGLRTRARISTAPVDVWNDYRDRAEDLCDEEDIDLSLGAVAKN
jgi:hypothetical protein